MILPNPHRENFAQAVAAGRPQTQAYEEAGFRARGQGARNCSLRLRNEPEVKARILELRLEAMAEYCVNRQELLDYLVEVIITPAGHVHEGDRLCHSYRNSRHYRATSMPDKLKAAEMLARICGWLDPEKPDRPIEVIVTLSKDNA